MLDSIATIIGYFVMGCFIGLATLRVAFGVYHSARMQYAIWKVASKTPGRLKWYRLPWCFICNAFTFMLQSRGTTTTYTGDGWSYKARR